MDQAVAVSRLTVDTPLQIQEAFRKSIVRSVTRTEVSEFILFSSTSHRSSIAISSLISGHRIKTMHDVEFICGT
jgi:hypothetical protein